MEPLYNIMSKVDNCGGDSANTGKLGCLQVFGTPLSAILITKGMVIPKETIFDLDYIRGEVQKGNFIPLMNASSFEDMSSEDTMSTNAAGVERLNLQGLPKWKFMFEEGHEFYRQMAKLTSFKSKDAIVIDDMGNWLFGVNSNGDYVGLTAGQINPEMRKVKVQGGDAESKAVTIQFLDRLQWDYFYGIVERAELGFTTSEVPAINGVNLSFEKIPAASDPALEVKAVLASDNVSLVEGLTETDFIVSIGGVANQPSAVTELPAGHYALTVPGLSLNDEVVVSLFDQSANLDVVDSNDVLYRSNLLSADVVA